MPSAYCPSQTKLESSSRSVVHSWGVIPSLMRACPLFMSLAVAGSRRNICSVLHGISSLARHAGDRCCEVTVTGIQQPVSVLVIRSQEKTPPSGHGYGSRFSAKRNAAA